MEKIKNLFEFLDSAYSVFHVIKNIKSKLEDSKFIELNLNENFNLEEGKNYFLTINNSSIIAFKIPKTLKKENIGFTITASHSDSPTFKLKPNPVVNKSGYSLLNLEAYGGGIYHTFINKPLSIAGRVCYEEDNKVITKLINIEDNLAFIPSLPIHFNSVANTNLAINPQIDMQALILEGDFDFLSFISNYINIDKNKILSHDLFIYNTEKSNFIGIEKEFFGSKKIDNLESAYCSLEGFLESNNPFNINVYVCFDNEEIGSKTKQGADSIFLNNVLSRIAESFNFDFKLALCNSFFVSIDNAHSVNPNHLEKYDLFNKAVVNHGVVIKNNANQRYTTEAVASSLFKKILKEKNIEFQDFSNRSDIRGGSTLGALASSFLSCLSIDIGLAQFAMHSSYEFAGCKDFYTMIEAVKAIYSKKILCLKDGNYEILA